MVKEIEQKLIDFEITYDEYKKNTGVFMDANFKDKDNENIFGFLGKIYKGKDLVGVKKDEMLQLREKLEKATGEEFGNIKSRSTKISKVYNDETVKCKHIFVKQNLQFTKFGELIQYKKYWIKEIDGKWKIIGIDKSVHSSDRITATDIEFNERYNGKDIEYIEKIEKNF